MQRSFFLTDILGHIHLLLLNMVRWWRWIFQSSAEEIDRMVSWLILLARVSLTSVVRDATCCFVSGCRIFDCVFMFYFFLLADDFSN